MPQAPALFRPVAVPLPPGFDTIAAAVAVRRSTPGLTLARVAVLSRLEHSYLSRVETGGVARVTPAFAARYCAAVASLAGRPDLAPPALPSVPYGFALAADGATLTADPGEQAVIAAARSYRAAGLCNQQIAERLHSAEAGR